MSDFGFDAYALDEGDAHGGVNPLEIARDLIAAGKPRSALEVLADQHARLSDDPEYLMLCGEAWCSAGDTPRAQHALLGAIRLAPRDPRPLHLLGHVLVERGEHERADQAFEKARRLELADEDPEQSPEAAEPDDLIAFAEREERAKRAPANPRQVAAALAVIAGVGLLLSGIAHVVTPPDPTEEESRSARSPSGEITEQPVPLAAVLAEPPPVAEAASDPAAAEPAPSLEAPPSEESILLAPSTTPPVAAEPPPSAVAAKPARKVRAKANSKPTAQASEKAEAARLPTDAEIEAELQAMNEPSALNARADELYATGQSGHAAKFYRRALELDPDYAPALVGVGRGLLRAEKYSEAMANATRALQLARGIDARPGLEAQALYQMGRVYHQRGEQDTARRLLRQAISLPRTPAEAWFYLGESLASENSPAARDAYEQYLERVPNGHLSARAQRAIQ